MKLLFVSDAHYPLSEKIVEFLGDVYLDYDKIYILGDLFEFYYGYSHFIYPHHFRLINLLACIGRKRKLILFEGNHEYRLEYIRKYVNAEIVKEFKEEKIDGYTVFMGHGDTIDKRDIAYRFFRGFLKSRIMLAILEFVPKDILLEASKRASHFSKTTLRDKSCRRTAVALEDFAFKKVKDGYDVVILAHTHEPVFKKIKNGLYINTGDFLENYTYVVYERGEFTLKSL